MDDIDLHIAKWPVWGVCPERHRNTVLHSTIYRGMLVHFWPNGSTPDTSEMVCVTPFSDVAGVSVLLDRRWWPDKCPTHELINGVCTRCLELWVYDDFFSVLGDEMYPGRYCLRKGESWTDWIDTNLWGEYDAYTGSQRPVASDPMPEIGVDVHSQPLYAATDKL